MQTQLIINRGGFPPFSARGCRQVLQPRLTGELRRTINGELHYTGQKHHHKYISTITCHDKTVPALEGLWRGELVKVACIQHLWQEVDVQNNNKITVKLERHAVQESVNVIDEVGREIAFNHQQPDSVEINNQEKCNKVYVCYRPYLQMYITKFHVHTDEWDQKCEWRLDLEER